MSNTRDHERFCKNDGWEAFKTGKDHKWYRKIMPDGTVKTTMTSHSYKDYGKGMFARILKDQLQVDRSYFNSKL